MKKNHLLVGILAFLIVIPMMLVFGAAESTTRGLVRASSPTSRAKPIVPPTLPEGGAALTGQKYALVIGISDYDGTDSDLQYCDEDAVEWKNYLESQGYQVTMLLDAQATKANILSALQDLADVEDEAGDGIAICYSGHGYYSRTVGESCLISWELSGIYTSEIEVITDTFDSEHVFFFDDACNQGTMVNLINAGWVAAIGSTTKTYTYDGDATMQNGIFTYYAMEAISMGYSTGEAIGTYAVNMFDAETRGDATLYDAYTIGDLNIA